MSPTATCWSTWSRAAPARSRRTPSWTGIHLTEKPVTEAINEVADGEITAADIDTHINK